jgi:hypothetical protein
MLAARLNLAQKRIEVIHRGLPARLCAPGLQVPTQAAGAARVQQVQPCRHALGLSEAVLMKRALSGCME